jgi:HEPN domain-containing protein
VAYDWRNWMDLARRELAEAKLALEAGATVIVVFYAHQVAEEALKGLWIERGDGTPPKSHELVGLARGVDAPPEVQRACMILNPLYATSRYPDAANGNPADMYDAQMAREMLDLAEGVFEWCSSQLQS